MSTRIATEGIRLAAVGLSAFLFVCSFPLPSHSALAWICLVPLLIVVRTAPGRTSIAAAGLWGMAAAYGVTDWLPGTLERYYGQPYWAGMALFLSASALMGAAEYMFFAAVYRRTAHRYGGAFTVLVASAAWVVAELGRARLFTGNPWGLLGYSQLSVSVAPPQETLSGTVSASSMLEANGPGAWLAERVVQNADWGGVYAVGFALVAVNVAIVEACVASRVRSSGGPNERSSAGVREPNMPGAMTAAVLTATIVSLTALGYGEMRLREFAAADAEDEIPVLLVQGNVDIGARWDPSHYGKNLTHYLDLTREGLRASSAAENGSAPRFAVWPENAVTFFVDQEPDYRRTIARVLEPTGTSLLLGAPRHEGRHDPIFFNSAFLLSPSGSITGAYDKEHLLPFAEYFPFGAIGFLRDAFGRVREFTPANRASTLPTPAGEAGIGICNEAMFPRIMRNRVHDSTAFLVNLSNDSWVRASEFGEHQLSIARMRAIEHRRFLLRSSTSGPSAVIDAVGAVRAKLGPEQNGYLTGALIPASGSTFYGRNGDLFAWMCMAAVAMSLMLRARGAHPRS